MRKVLLSLLVLVTTVAHSQLTVSHLNNITGANNNTVYYYQFLPKDYTTNPGHLFPLIISLAGVGERGDGDAEMFKIANQGIPLLITQGATMKFTYNGQTESFVVLAPQLSIALQGGPGGNPQPWDPFYIDAMITYATGNLHIDPQRIFLTGFSLGGGGCWRYVTSSVASANKIAGIAPVAGSGDYFTNGFCDVAAGKVATWAFAAVDDPDSYGFTNTAVAGINNAACNPVFIPARARIYQDGGHNIWNDRGYDTTNTWQYPNVFQWMMKVSRSINAVSNTPPTAVALGKYAPTSASGNNLVLTVPVRSRDLKVDGLSSTDPDDIISEYLWQQVPVSGTPATFFPSRYTPFESVPTSDRPADQIVKDNFNNAGLMDLGTYTYKLTVKDYKSQTSTATATIQVKLPATGNALPGVAFSPQTKTLTTSQSNYDVTAEVKDYDGFIPDANYQWVVTSRPAGSSIPTITNNQFVGHINNINAPGTYTIQLTVTDNSGGQGSDVLTIIKQGNPLPVTFSYIKGKNLAAKNIINFGTATEQNNDHFEIQRSADGSSFTTIGTVAAKGGNTGSDYVFEDAGAPQGTSYYRLKQVDIDGRSTLSKVISITNTGRKIAIETYPNPVKDKLVVTVEGNSYGSLQVMVADMQGKVVRQEQWKKEQTLLTSNLSLSTLRSGVYQLIIVSPDGSRNISSIVKY